MSTNNPDVNGIDGTWPHSSAYQQCKREPDPMQAGGVALTPTVPHPAAQQERDRVNRLIEAAIAEHRCPPGYAAGGHNPVVNALRRLQEQVLAPKEQT